MLKYRTAFVRGLVLMWLTTWVLADPLWLFQTVMTPQEHIAARSVIGNRPAGTHVTQHHLDALLSSSTEGNPNPKEDVQSDEIKLGDRPDMLRSNGFWSVVHTPSFPRYFAFFTSASPRAPPRISL